MRLMHLKVKKLQNGTIKVFRKKQATTNVSLVFLNVVMLKNSINTVSRDCKPTRKL